MESRCGRLASASTRPTRQGVENQFCAVAMVMSATIVDVPPWGRKKGETGGSRAVQRTVDEK